MRFVRRFVTLAAISVIPSSIASMAAQNLPQPPTPPAPPASRPRDPAAEATTVREVPAERPEQKFTEHDRSPRFNFKNPAPLTPVFKEQRQLLASRYDMTPRFDPQIKMSRGKTICVGPTARLAEGMIFVQFGQMSPD